MFGARFKLKLTLPPGSAMEERVTFDPPGEFLLGREGVAQLSFRDASVSRRHVLLRCIDFETWLVQGLAPRNVTLLNGHEIGPDPVQLPSEGTLQLGGVSFRFELIPFELGELLQLGGEMEDAPVEPYERTSVSSGPSRAASDSARLSFLHPVADASHSGDPDRSRSEQGIVDAALPFWEAGWDQAGARSSSTGQSLLFSDDHKHNLDEMELASDRLPPIPTNPTLDLRAIYPDPEPSAAESDPYARDMGSTTGAGQPRAEYSHPILQEGLERAQAEPTGPVGRQSGLAAELEKVREENGRRVSELRAAEYARAQLERERDALQHALTGLQDDQQRLELEISETRRTAGGGVKPGSGVTASASPAAVVTALEIIDDSLELIARFGQALQPLLERIQTPQLRDAREQVVEASVRLLDLQMLLEDGRRRLKG